MTIGSQCISILRFILEHLKSKIEIVGLRRLNEKKREKKNTELNSQGCETRAATKKQRRIKSR